MTKVIIMRGIPGSGKSSWAEKHYPECHHCSADNYFTSEDGEYEFNPAEIGNAHRSCMKAFLTAIEFCEQIDSQWPIVVDNTHTQLWELSPYLQVARAMGYDVTVVTVQCDIDVAAKRNTHGVPENAIHAMANRFESIPPFWDCETLTVGETTLRTNFDGHDI